MLIVRLQGFADLPSEKIAHIQMRITALAGDTPELVAKDQHQIFFDQDMAYRQPPQINAKKKYYIVLGGLSFCEEKPSYLEDFAHRIVDSIKEQIDTSNSLLAVVTQTGRCLYAEFNHVETEVVLF